MWYQIGMSLAKNPFLHYFQTHSFQTRDEAIPFDKIQADDFIPALDFAIKQAQTRLKAIKANKETPNFENTILALEMASEGIETVSGTYHNLFSAEASEELQSLARDISQRVAAYSSEVSLDPELFAKIEVVYKSLASLNLDVEQTRLVEKFFNDFSRNGALLDSEKKERLRKIDQELAALAPDFAENNLKATNAFQLVINNKSDLLGLPDSAIEMASIEAQNRNLSGSWVFTLDAPSYIPFMQYSSNRELRRKLWTAYNSRCFKDKFDNSNNTLKIVKLRDQRAKLLGYASHAEFVLEERMAKDSKSVLDFLNRLLGPSKKAADRDMAELRAFKKTMDGSDDVQPWDFAFYSEKLKEKKYRYNEEELRPYFKLENVVEGVFEHGRRLYGLNFRELQDVPVYHPDVRAYEVREEKTQKYIGLFYTDFFPRPTKKPGAWMTLFREQGQWSGQVRRPHVSIVCNFTKPTPTKPSLLTYDEVQTLFHEFGHALHGLLSSCNYRTLAGTNVYWDFVELPSQIMENWVREKEGLDVFARHYQTGEAIPQEMVDKIRKAQLFQSGYYSMRQLGFAFLDMAWHNGKYNSTDTVEQFENKALDGLRVLPKVEGTNTSVSFAHIFAGGYSAGYYSYKWAEVLDADAFEYFREKGLFSREVADKFKNNILAKGGTEHPMELYKKFRGREPDPNALLRRDGLMTV